MNRVYEDKEIRYSETVLNVRTEIKQDGMKRSNRVGGGLAEHGKPEAPDEEAWSEPV